MILGMIAGVISSTTTLLGTFIFGSSLNPVAGIATRFPQLLVSTDASMPKRPLLLAAGLVGIASFGILVTGLSLLWLPARSC